MHYYYYHFLKLKKLFNSIFEICAWTLDKEIVIVFLMQA